jgi:hypothetical protein
MLKQFDISNANNVTFEELKNLTKFSQTSHGIETIKHSGFL